MIRDLKTQFSVIAALTIHDLQGQMRRYDHGYVWLILEPMMFIALLRLARHLFSPLAPPNNMTPLLFYTLGVLPLFMVFQIVREVYKTVASRSRLLTFPRVTPIDLAISGAVSSFCTYFTIFWVFAVPISMYEGVWPPENPLGLMLALIATWMLAVAVGLVLSPLVRVLPPAERFIIIGKRGLRLISGLFFVITMVPTIAWPYFTWNPLLHLIELMRDTWFSGYTSPVASWSYIAECILVLLLLGLSLERFMRRIPYA